jgi:hypothetical protein
VTMRESQMTRELKLDVPDSLLFSLERKALEQGTSLEVLCLSLLSGTKQGETLVDPDYYSSLSHYEMRQEVRKVIGSDLPREQVKRRVNQLEFQISKRYIR